MITMSRQEFLLRSGVDGEALAVWLEQRWIVPQESAGGGAFCDADLARAALITQLKGGLGVNDEGVDVILHLMDQMHGLRRALREIAATRP